MKVAVDAMGGDFAPAEIVKGTLLAIDNNIVDSALLVGCSESIEKYLPKNFDTQKIKIVHTSQVIGMSESPIGAIKAKPQASMLVAIGQVCRQEADFVVSAGNTGAFFAGAITLLGKIKGITRPAICTIIPTITSYTLLLDVGANVDCKPQHLLEFALMGNAYAQCLNGKSNPTIGILNIGTENNKGNKLTQLTYKLLSQTPLNFIGNVEGPQILQGGVDVVICDGFVGNVVLKFAEGVAEIIMENLRKQLVEYQDVFNKIFENLAQKVDYAEYGGAPLLGVNGLCIIAHGRSKAKAIMNAIKLGSSLIKRDLNSYIANMVEKI